MNVVPTFVCAQRTRKWRAANKTTRAWCRARQCFGIGSLSSRSDRRKKAIAPTLRGKHRNRDDLARRLSFLPQKHVAPDALWSPCARRKCGLVAGLNGFEYFQRQVPLGPHTTHQRLSASSTSGAPDNYPCLLMRGRQRPRCQPSVGSGRNLRRNALVHRNAGCRRQVCRWIWMQFNGL